MDDDYDVSQEYLKQLTEKYADIEHPLFMNEIPRSISSNPDLEALQQLLAEGETRDTIAEKYKDVGNGYVENGPKFYKAAISSYSNGIEAESKDEKLNSQLYSNRAYVYLKLGNFVECVNDCRNSIKFDKKALKAYYRGAMASLELELYKQALEFCKGYLSAVYPHSNEKEDKNTEYELLLRSSVELANVYRNIVSKLEERSQELKNEKIKTQKLSKKRKPKEKISILNKDGIKLKPNIYKVPESQNVKFYQEDGILHTSCLIIYDELSMTDFIEDLNYSSSMGDHLDVMFPDSNYAAEGFSRNNSRCFYEIAEDVLYEFDVNEQLSGILIETKVAFRLAAVHILHKNVEISAFPNYKVVRQNISHPDMF